MKGSSASFLAFVLFFIIELTCGEEITSANYFTCFVDSQAKHGFVVKNVKDVQNGACYGFFDDQISKDGWARLSLWSNAQRFSDKVQIKACGFLEGFLTHERIWQNKINSWDTDFEESGGVPPQKLFDWMKEHRAWLKTQNLTDPFFNQINLIHEQLQSMADSIEEFGLINQTVSFEDLCMMNSGGDSGDILNSLGMKYKTNNKAFNQMNQKELLHYLDTKGHCSAIVKATPDLSELFISHTTWGHYGTMLRCFKSYHFPLSGIASKGMIFPGYFGLIVSDDDLYSMEDTKLAVTETTNDVISDDLWKFITPKSALYWERVLTANRLSDNGKTWTEIFSRYQSGTYSNQWMIVDFKKFSPKKQIGDNTLWIIELCPGKVHSEDVSNYLKSSHWPSFNRPFFEDMFTMMGYEAATEKYGEIFSYDSSPRSNIFRRDAGAIIDIETLKSFMTSNKWKSDPYSYGFPGNAVSARFDLKGGPKTGSPWDSWWKLGPHGGSDCKIVSSSMITDSNHLEMVVVNGPPVNDDCKPFEWTDQWINYSHIGHPNKFNFPWVKLSNDEL